MSLVRDLEQRQNCVLLTLIQIHALVAKGQTILAEHQQSGKRDFSQGMVLCIPSVGVVIFIQPDSNTNYSFENTSEWQVKGSSV